MHLQTLHVRGEIQEILPIVADGRHQQLEVAEEAEQLADIVQPEPLLQIAEMGVGALATGRVAARRHLVETGDELADSSDALAIAGKDAGKKRSRVSRRERLGGLPGRAVEAECGTVLQQPPAYGVVAELRQQ